MIINANKAKPEQRKSITPDSNTLTVTPDAGHTLSSVTVYGDSDLKPSNIREGVNIFGYTGTYAGTEVVVGTISPSSNSNTIYIDAAIGKENIVVFIDSYVHESNVVDNDFAIGMAFYLSDYEGRQGHQINEYDSSSTSTYWNQRGISWTPSTGKLRSTAANKFQNSFDYIYIAW